MKNINIVKTDNNTWVVKADSDRFGIQAIMYERVLPILWWIAPKSILF